MQDKYLLDGYVYYDEDGGDYIPPTENESTESNGVQYARVNAYMYDEDGSWDSVGSMLSEEDGYYSFYLESNEDYWIEAWINDEDGYGYHVNNTDIHLTEDKSINLNLEKKHVANFKVTDKHGVALDDIDIQLCTDGTPVQTISVDAYGEAIVYMWNENADYTFDFLYNGKSIYKDPTIYRADETHKLEIPVTINELGLENVISGQVVYKTPEKLVEDVEVTLHEVDVTGPWNNDWHYVETAITDAEGNFAFGVDDVTGIYRVSARAKKLSESGEKNYYISDNIDPRFLGELGNKLELSQAPSITINVEDKNGFPLEGVLTGIEFQHGSVSKGHTDSQGERLLSSHGLTPGNYLVWAEMKIDGNTQRRVHALEIVEGKYNYNYTFQFDVESKDRLATVTIPNKEVKVGDAVLVADAIRIGSINGSEKSWSCWADIEDTETSIVIPEEYRDEKVMIEVFSQENITLFQDEVTFAGNMLEKTVDLSDRPTYSLDVSLEVTTSSALQIEPEIDLSVELIDWWNSEQQSVTVAQDITDQSHHTFTGLIDGRYRIRAEHTTPGGLYVNTTIVDSGDLGSGTDLHMKLVPATEFTVVFQDEQGNALVNKNIEIEYRNASGRYASTAVRTDRRGSATFLEGLHGDKDVTISIYSDRDTNYSIIGGHGNSDEFSPEDGETYIITVRAEKRQ